MEATETAAQGLAPLASIDDLQTKIGGKGDTDKLNLALSLASGRFRGQANNPISLTTETVTLDTQGASRIMLPAAPVHDVTRVQVDGTDTAYEWSASGVLRFDNPLPDRYRALQVTYTHGYDPIPDDIRDVVLEQAAAIYNLLPGVMSYTVGAESRSYSTALTVGTTAQWAACVARYRIGD